MYLSKDQCTTSFFPDDNCNNWAVEYHNEQTMWEQVGSWVAWDTTITTNLHTRLTKSYRVSKVIFRTQRKEN